ncbi:MAG: O-antigen ligase family protein [Bacteroidales bacterium]
MQRDKHRIWLVLFLSLLFIAANSFLLFRQSFGLSLVPIALVIGMWVFFAPTKLFFALAFLVPLSIPLRRLVPGLTFDFWFPTEPILVFLLVMVILKSFKENYFRKELMGEPVFLAMLFYLGWLLITVVTSEMPVVSIKYFLVRFWFIGVFFYLAYILFSQNFSNVRKFGLAYILGLFCVALFSIVKQASLGLLSHKVAHGASAPFFIDHTSYGAALAFVIPLAVAMALNETRRQVKLLFWGLALFFMLALVLSYSRAAWLSLLIGGGVWLLIRLKVKLRTLVVTLLVLVAAFFTFQEEILWRLERNTTDSSGNLTEHVRSVINIKSDASNLERINRWDAAIAMFKQRPFVGWGPGTYQFEYAPFQLSQNKTIISTNFGTGGNAHSEYLGLMAEAGLPSIIGFMLIIIFILIQGFRLVQRKGIDRAERNITIACIVGLVTYIFHGFLNNFLDTDKIAAVFWGFMAIIVAIDQKVKHRELQTNERLPKFEA